MSGIGWIDWLLLAALVLSMLVGLWRGFVLEVLALAGWVVAYFAAHWLAPMWAPHLPIGAAGSNLNFVAAFAITFIAVLVLWGLASRLVRLLINATPLRGVDRVLGALFGVVRGAGAAAGAGHGGRVDTGSAVARMAALERRVDAGRCVAADQASPAEPHHSPVACRFGDTDCTAAGGPREATTEGSLSMCGIVGAISKSPVNQLIYDALLLLQHRGQDAAGIVTMQGTKCFMHKARGMVRDVFRTRNMRALPGNIGLGQVRYPTAGNAWSEEEAQPFYVNAPFGIVLVHNGNLTNAPALKSELFRIDRRHINTESDTEVLINILAHEIETAVREQPLTPDAVFRAVAAVHKRLKGSYSVIALIAGHGLLAFRDPFGIRPLVFGELHTDDGSEFVVASESVAIEGIGRQVVRDVAPGEAVFVDVHGGVHTRQCAERASSNPCMFEYVYLARPDSVIDGISVYQARLNMGETLAQRVISTMPPNAIDVVIPIPESSRPSAMQLAQKIGKPYREGFVKNRYVGPHLHHARAGGAQEDRAAEAQRHRRGVQGPQRAAGRRLDRARHHQQGDRADGARGRREEGLHGLGRAAGEVPERLRHRHAHARGTDRRGPQHRADPRVHRRRRVDLPGRGRR